MPEKHCGFCGSEINAAQEAQAEDSLEKTIAMSIDSYRDGYKKGLAVGAAYVLHHQLPTAVVVAPPDSAEMLQWALTELGDPRQVQVAAEEEE